MDSISSAMSKIGENTTRDTVTWPYFDASRVISSAGVGFVPPCEAPVLVSNNRWLSDPRKNASFQAQFLTLTDSRTAYDASERFPPARASVILNGCAIAPRHYHGLLVAHLRARYHHSFLSLADSVVWVAL